MERSGGRLAMSVPRVRPRGGAARPVRTEKGLGREQAPRQERSDTCCMWQNARALPDDITPLDFVFLADPISVHTTRWVEGLRGRGHRVILVPSKEPGRRGPAKLARWILRRWRLRRLVSRSGTVLVVQYVPAGVRALVLLGLHPRIGVAWGSDIYMTTNATLRLAVSAVQQRMFLGGCDTVIAPSHDLVRATIAAGARRDRARVVPFGVDIGRFRPGPDPTGLRSRLGLEGCRVVLSNRTIAPLYNQTTVVEALARLPSDVVVLMTRHLARRSEVEAVERRAQDLNVGHRVRIVDRIADDEMPDLYRLADVVVSVAGSDGGPITILEAMACGRQIVASDLPSIREWLTELDPDALVPVGDAAATARAIQAALDRTPAERAELARRERAAVERGGDRELALTAMESLHRALTGGHPRPES